MNRNERRKQDQDGSARELMSAHQCRRAAGVLLVAGWVFWLHRWVPAVAVAAFVAWVLLHKRLEAGLGDTLHRQWRRAWPPGPVVLSGLLCASTLAFVFHDASVTGKILPVGLNVLALWLILFGTWWTPVALPRWLGGAGRVTPGWARTATGRARQADSRLREA